MLLCEDVGSATLHVSVHLKNESSELSEESERRDKGSNVSDFISDGSKFLLEKGLLCWLLSLFSDNTSYGSSTNSNYDSFSEA